MLLSFSSHKIVSFCPVFPGCMLCLGRSNYFRFNHPKEAERIKNAIPGDDKRISVTPVGFIPGMLHGHN